MLELCLATLFFLGIHLAVSGTRLRDALVGRLGERTYMVIFSLASLAGISWMSRAYAAAPATPLWGQIVDLRGPVLLVVFFAFLLAFVGVTTPSPTAAGGEARLDDPEPARGILRITRHPFLWGVALWAFAHLLVNGDAASLVLFGGLLGLALAGPASIDAKRARRHGQRWERFAARTSNLPFAAVAAGRNRLGPVVREIGWWRPLLAVALFAVALIAHRALFGVSPLPA